VQSDKLEYACKHTFFEDPLPGGNDYEPSHDHHPLTQCYAASGLFLAAVPDHCKDAVQAAVKMLGSLSVTLNTSGTVDNHALDL
jgi:hypothetical protein